MLRGGPARVLSALSSGKICPARVMPKACLNKAPPDEQVGREGRGERSARDKVLDVGFVPEAEVGT